jgi:hypothetical protein
MPSVLENKLIVTARIHTQLISFSLARAYFYELTALAFFRVVVTRLLLLQ